MLVPFSYLYLTNYYIHKQRLDVFSVSDLESSWMASMSDQEWQLYVVKSFFDQCVPNQPGFSSSVAAITILPNANDLAAAWRSWYACAAKLRRLRFIRSLITELKRESNLTSNGIEDGIENEGAISDSLDSSRALFGSVDCTKIEEQLFEALEYGPGML